MPKHLLFRFFKIAFVLCLGARERSSRPPRPVGRRKARSGSPGSCSGKRQPPAHSGDLGSPDRGVISKRDRRELLRLWLPARLASLPACTVATAAGSPPPGGAGQRWIHTDDKNG